MNEIVNMTLPEELLYGVVRVPEPKLTIPLPAVNAIEQCCTSPFLEVGMVLTA